MTSLSNKKIILGVCAGIAAYKSADLVRRLTEVGAEVQVVLTKNTAEFVSPLTFQALSGKAVRDTLFDKSAEAAMGHIELARWADMILIAPATANFIACLANGFANNLLTTLCLATRSTITIAPAMNTVMWENNATQANIRLLKQRGIHIVGPDIGEQACGENGPGRMLEPTVIRSNLIDYFSTVVQCLSGKQVLLTTGPTLESIDPVRYISNHSSGKMGFAVAEAAHAAGAKVTVIAGPTLINPSPDIEVIQVKTAQQMLSFALLHAQESDVFISVAAVADYRVKQVNQQKIKKSEKEITLTLTKNPDILAQIAALKTARPFCVGFAAETNNLKTYAIDKLKSKNLDMIAANLVSNDTHNVFNSDDNTLEIFLRDSRQISLAHAPKSVIARQLVKLIAEQLTKS